MVAVLLLVLPLPAYTILYIFIHYFSPFVFNCRAVPISLSKAYHPRCYTSVTYCSFFHYKPNICKKVRLKVEE
jgi:hypothetical protein